MITEEQIFKPSVNIKLDKNNHVLLKSYLPTPSHAEAFLGVLNSFLNSENIKSHIITGAYGTGKSFLAMVLSSLLSKRIEKKTFKLLLKKYSSVNDEIYKQLQDVSNIKTTYIPVLLNGYEGSFRKAIIKALLREINESNLNIALPGVIQSIVQSINTWKNDFPRTYQLFMKEVTKKFVSMDHFIQGVHQYKKNHINWFISIYPQLTSGSNFNIDIEQDFISQIQFVISQLRKKNLGIFFIYDEFGRFIQNLNQNQIHEAMQDIQDLAELCNGTNDLHMLLITHKNLGNYSFKYNSDLNDEFARIEKRFMSYNINSDPATFLRLSHEVISNMRNSYRVRYEKDYSDHLLPALKMFPLFPELNDVEIENIVLKGCYPLHPVTTFMLPALSNIFAQNERTLFTFLESNEVGGLLDHLKNEKGVYLPYKLFDYFFNSVTKETIPEELKVYRKLIQKLPFSEESLEIQLLKFIALWNISGLQGKFKLTDEFISFALDYNLLLNFQLNELSDLKAIRFNRIHGYWELFNGSSINLEEVIEEKDKELYLSKKEQLSLINNFTTPKYYLANEYNYQKSMTRFGSVLPIWASDLLAGQVDTEKIRNSSHADAVIINVLLDGNANKEEVKEILLSWPDKNAFFATPSFPYKHLEKSLRKHSIVTKLMEDKLFLQEDPFLKKELLLAMEDIEYEVKDFLLNYSSFNGDITWIVNNKTIEIRNKILLENLLSDMMERIFPYTPEVRNDAFNRRNITTVQKKAAIKLVNHIINHNIGEEFNVEGNGPDYLIYATLLKNNGIDINKLSEISNENIVRLRSGLIHKLTSENQGVLHELIRIFSEEPFGIRKPLIPVLFVALLKEHWDNILFYRNGMYLSELNGEYLYSMLEEEHEFDYRYFEVKEEYKLLFDKINLLFLNEDKHVPKYHPQFLKNVLLTWLRSLPRVTQISEKMSSMAVEFKRIIRQLEIDPQNSLDLLNDLFITKDVNLQEIKTELDEFDSYQKQFMVKSILSITKSSNFSELYTWCEHQTENLKKNNVLVNTILNSNENEWIDNLAREVVGVDRTEWSDTTFEMFISQIKFWYNNIDDKPDNSKIEIKVGEQVKVIQDVNLSNKSQLIYQNVNRMIKNAGRTVSKEEIEIIVFKLINEFIK
ncbi:hypothetical protein P4361_05875 [Fictibacillus sp. B-59209]|uniref:hypothetical protein n=1 Tax=Fictibacillus sp. B-59209 TaxID=3024873 RepID=UPI002E1C157E|nr:hypothetical protein [Fictibacillus sp. B-59209]